MDIQNSIHLGLMENMSTTMCGELEKGLSSQGEKQRQRNGYSTKTFWEAVTMTVEQFKETLMCNEPDFGYNGQEYSIFVLSEREILCYRF